MTVLFINLKGPLLLLLLNKWTKKQRGSFLICKLKFVLQKVLEQLTLETTSGPMKDKKVVRCSQHGFTKGNSYLTSPITYDEMTTLIEGRAMDIVYLDLRKTFDTVSYKILID